MSHEQRDRKPLRVKAQTSIERWCPFLAPKMGRCATYRIPTLNGLTLMKSASRASSTSKIATDRPAPTGTWQLQYRNATGKAPAA